MIFKRKWVELRSCNFLKAFQLLVHAQYLTNQQSLKADVFFGHHLPPSDGCYEQLFLIPLLSKILPSQLPISGANISSSTLPVGDSWAISSKSRMRKKCQCLAPEQGRGSLGIKVFKLFISNHEEAKVSLGWRWGWGWRWEIAGFRLFKNQYEHNS